MSRAALVAAALVAALASPALAQESTWSRPTAPFRIMDNTWYVGTEGLSVYLITTPAGHVLIDGGLPQNAALVEASIATLGFKLSDVKILLNTHAHYDHSGGLAKLKADTGATFYAHSADVYALEKGVYPGSEEITAFNAPPVKVDRTVEDGGTVTLGGVTFTAHLTPGHSAGCTSWTWPVKDGGTTHTAINFCSASVAANSLIPEQYPGIVADYQKTFATAPKIAADLFLAPHGEQFGLAAKRARIAPGQPNPFIDRAGYLRLLANQQAAFERSLAQAQQNRRPQ